ncbi:beta-N-acetylhexosaminidase [Phocaeicola faecalis]
MKKRSLFLFFIGLLMCGCQMKESVNAYNIVPFPTVLDEKSGRFYLDNDVPIVVNASQEVKDIASDFSSRLFNIAGLKLKISDELYENVASIVFDSVAGMSREAYSLSVTPKQIKITASAPNGFYYGLQSLYQLLPPEVYGDKPVRNADWSLPCVEINDAPAFRYRGVMLDGCRHFASVDYIKKFIDILAMHKMNTFHWHLTDDQGWRIEIKKYPKLTEVGSKRSETMIDYFYTHYPFKYDGKPHGGFYTQEEIKDVVAYAKSRYVTVIPEIELPGHALAAIAAYPELSCTPDSTYEVAKLWGVFDQVFCPTDTLFSFLEGVMDEVVELFPGEYIHIGGDECPKNAWEECSHCQKLIRELGLKEDAVPNPIDGKKHTKEEKLQSYIVGRIEKYLNTKGRNIIGWDEILEGGLAPNATVMSWRGVEGGVNAAKAGHDAIMTPNPYAYLDHYQEDPEIAPVTIGGYNTLKKTYSYNPVPTDADSLVKRHIIGLQANCWSEYMPTEDRRDYQIFPRLMAIAETGWTPMDRKDFHSFCERMEEDFERLDILGVKACRNFFDVNINTRATESGILNVELETFRPNTQIYYTINGTEPTLAGNLYTGPFPLSGVYELKAAAFVDGNPVGKVTHKKLYGNLISGKKYKITPEPTGMKGDVWDENDVLGADSVTLGLTNGKRGNDASSTPWVGILPDANDKVTFVVELDGTNISKIRFGTLYNAAGGVLPVSKAIVFVSDSDKNFRKIVEKDFTYDIKENTFKGFDEVIEFPVQTDIIGVKIEFFSGGKIRNGIDCYSPHDRSEVPGLIALDEIEIY